MHTPLDLTGVWIAFGLAWLLAASMGLAVRAASARRAPPLVSVVLVVCAALFTTIGIVMGGLLWLFA